MTDEQRTEWQASAWQRLGTGTQLPSDLGTALAEIERLDVELAVCRETNRRIHEQDTANVAKLQAIRKAARAPVDDDDPGPLFSEFLIAIRAIVGDWPSGGTA